VAKTKKLRIAFIGAGGIAGAHMSYLSKFDDVELVALADVNEAGMAKHAKTYNVPQTFTDYKEMLAKVQPEAVSVCTPNGLHAPNTIAALNAGANVLVEKPLAMNAKEGQAMLDAAKKNKKKLVIGFQYRYGSNSTYLKKAVDAGSFGKIMYGRCQALRRRGIPNWGVFGRKELQGGGPMIDIGVHILECTHFVMGSPKPVAAFGNTWTYMGNKKSDVASSWPNWDHKTYTVEDLAVGQIRFENGAILTIESSFVAHIEKDVFNFSIMGEKAGGTWDPPTMYKDDGGYMVNQSPAFTAPSGFGDHFQAKMRNFVDHVLYNKPTLAPAEHGLMVQKMLDGIYASAAKGKEVDID
jgi:predicted dehydrogenase